MEAVHWRMKKIEQLNQKVNLCRCLTTPYDYARPDIWSPFLMTDFFFEKMCKKEINISSICTRTFGGHYSIYPELICQQSNLGILSRFYVLTTTNSYFCHLETTVAHISLQLKYLCATLTLNLNNYSRISISRTRISRILRNSKRLSESKIHFIAFSNHTLALETFLQVQITRSAN